MTCLRSLCLFVELLDILHLSATNRALHECFLNHRKTIIYCRARSDIANFDFAIDLGKSTHGDTSELS